MSKEKIFNYIGVCIILGVLVVFPALSVSLCNMEYVDGIPFVSYCNAEYDIIKVVASKVYTFFFFSLLLLGAPFILYGGAIYVIIKIYFFITHLVFDDEI